MQIHYLNDQSIFVRAAIKGVVREALIAALLTAAMILISGELAEHPDHRGLHSAFHPDFFDGAQRARGNHQHHDFGGIRAGGGHSGG